MEWTKKALKKKAILCTSKSQGKRILKFYKKAGFEIDNWMQKDGLDVGWFYGNFVGKIARISIDMLKHGGYEQFKIPSTPRRKFPREMMVSSNGENWYRRLVFCKLPKPISKFVANRHSPETKGMEKQNTFLKSWKYAKEIEYEEDDSGKLELF